MTVNQLYAFIDSHSETEFWALYNSEPVISADVQSAMDYQADWLIGSAEAAASRAERHACGQYA